MSTRQEREALKAQKAQLDERIAELEGHQTGRREHIRTIKDVMKRKQLEIDNLKAARRKLDETPASPPTPASRAGLSACP